MVRDMYIWETGALADPNATNDELVKGTHAVSYKGLELSSREKFIIGFKK